MELEQLDTILVQLNQLRTYLVKIGPSRRKGDLLVKKYSEANKCYNSYLEVIGIVQEKFDKNEYTQDTQKYVLGIKYKVESLYRDIFNLCNFQETSTDKMESKVSFDLKTAVNLLPIMTDDESVTQKLIDAIELYNSMLNTETKCLLVNFILKTRLSRNAKLRLNTKYDDVESLLRDMKLHLLTKKSDVALQSKLQSTVQANKSIEEFGQEIEKLFVELTISQADGEPSKYEILRPLNEKNAIKRFADGLRSQKLSTIIAARNYSTLKDAIRAAEDESLVNPPPPFMTYQRGQFRGRRGYNNFNRGRPQYYPRSYYNNSYHNNDHFHNNSQRYSYYNRGFSSARNAFRGANPTRGRGVTYQWQNNNRSSRGAFTNRNQRKINYAAPSSTENNESSEKFFRP
ncbi:uncharacterized protein [Maniola hyperantus]|uniref:uncharacterized protein n=1 Tax=Aphantopus hyperantus TaxID=2795564 RepID=UPI0037494B0D